MLIRKFKKGDTIIEVMFATSVFAMAMVGGLAIMNATYARTIASLQLTMARNAIDSQAEAFRYANAAYISNFPNPVTTNTPESFWQNTIVYNAKGAEKLTPLSTCPSNSDMLRNEPKGIAADTRTENTVAIAGNRGLGGVNGFRSAVTFPQIAGPSLGATGNVTAQGVWTEVISPTGGEGADYYDLHIRACWVAPGNSAPTTLGTIVRLYAPKS